jgi:hypothetical protein
MAIMAIPTTKEYRFERLTSLYYPLLQKLFRRVYSTRVSLEELEKRFDTSLLGKNVVGFIAIHNSSGEPASYYGVFPMNVQIENKIISIGQSGDLMTDPQHRNKNLFIQLAELTHIVCKDEGMKMIISQPNQNSLHGFVNKLGFKIIDEIIRWDLKLGIKTVPLSKLVNSNKTFKKIYLPYVKRILKKYIVPAPSLFNNPLEVSVGKVQRDKAYIGYKNSEDRFFIKVENVLLWIRLTDVFWIGDFDNYDAINPVVIKRIKRLAFLLGYNTISLNMNAIIKLPESLKIFSRYSSQPSCILYMDETFRNINIILAAADSDTW